MATKKTKGLGRGLDALLGADAEVINTLGQSAQDSISQTLPISRLTAGKYQPRTRMDEGALNELAESIKTQGIMQPILVRPVASGGAGRYEIIAGERRFRAAHLAGLTEVPVLIKNVADENAAAMALIENIQREDLNPLEEANGVKRLIDEFGLTHEAAAEAIGRSRSATTNMLRLLNLIEPVQTMLLAGDIDMGHARALLALDGAAQIQIANLAVAHRWSVRETEKKVNQYKTGDHERKLEPIKDNNTRDIARIEESLSDATGVAVSVKANKKGKGTLSMSFHTWEGFNNLLEKLKLEEFIKEN
jgi:ParB family transcriptional regulator, chromosome partitioning protein